MAFKVIVDGKKCMGCEECLEACTVQIFEMQGGKCIPTNVQDCIGCRSCADVCKEEAIQVEELQPEMSEIARLLLGDILSD
jgi:NAD-dependent dihydropyrimidine dehydrogenase PreA subunit